MREHAEKHDASAGQALQKRMEERAVEFVSKGGELYQRAGREVA